MSVVKDDAYKLLKSEINNRGIKAIHVAKEIGISQQYFSQVLNGNRKLSTDIAIKASYALGLPVDYFLVKS